MKFIDFVLLSSGRILCVTEMRYFVFFNKITLSNLRSETASTTLSRKTHQNPYNIYHKPYNLCRV